MKLSREETISLISGNGAWHTNDCNGKLPSILLSDGPHGLRMPEGALLGHNNDSKYATAFPTASAAACSWDRELIAKEASAIADEALANKVSVVLGPGVNIKRIPLCGRNFEYYSEDPYLAGSLATSFVNAMQEKGVGTSLKHYAGNNQESNRMISNSQIDERALREIYTAAFEMTVRQAQPTTIMACYNMVNGEYGTQNKHLLTDLLRDKWGFKGLVVSDWGACSNLPKSIEAGMDLEMPGNKGVHFGSVRRALKSGTLSKKALTTAAGRVANLARSQGAKLIDHTADLKNSHDVALQLSLGSAVLLKNDGILPLSAGGRIVVIGDLAVNTRFQGGGSSHINVKHVQTGVECLAKVGFDVVFHKGYDSDINLPLIPLEKEALDAIKPGDTVLFYGGLTDKAEGEGYDRKTLDIPYNQVRLVDKILEKTKDVVFVAFGGAPMNISFRHRVRAILMMYLGGEAVQESAAKLLCGEVSPSGKLAETFPLTLKSTPAYNFFSRVNLDVEYRESIFVGYRYYSTYGHKVMYPFGFGLSYTTFEYSDLRVPEEFREGKINVTLKVTNTGSRAGREAVQLYVGNPGCRYLRAAKELRGFAKTKLLEPGESQVLEITLDERSFSLFDVDRDDFIVPTGTYKIMIGASVEDIRLSKDIEVTGVDYNPDMTGVLCEYFRQEGEDFNISKEQFAKLYGKTLSNFTDTSRGALTMNNSIRQLAKHSLLGKLIFNITKQVVYAMHKDKPHDDPEVMMMISGAVDGTLDAIVCQSQGLLPYRLGQALVHAANGHSARAFIQLFGDFE
ncbi:MAG: glycosyl hydrolase [Lachnospiraceae bacterium]|nr:glycosyl hydrolase [Lachnospiraceae bacterium]